MTTSLWIDGPLPGLNDVIRSAKRRRYGRNGRCTTEWLIAKKDWSGYIVALAFAARLRPPALPVVVRCTWREKHDGRDPDNIAGGGHKIILDALVAAGVLPDDNLHVISGLEDRFEIDKRRPGVLVELIEA